MAKFEISAVYEYGGVVEAENEEEAYDVFINELEMHYGGLYSLDVIELEEESEDGE